MINSVIKILLIEDESFDVRRVKNTLDFYNNKIELIDVVSNGNSAIDAINERPDVFDIVIMDYQIAGGLRGEKLIKKIKELDPSIQIIVITKMTINITDFDFANRLMKAGAFWYCTKYPGDIEEYIYQPTDFLMSILNAYEKKNLEKISLRSNKKLQNNIDNILEGKKIIGGSNSIEIVKKQILRYAESDANILINGSSGTGKELVAYNIHYKSERKYENFVPINCGSLPHDLIESELFGYERGSFTGAGGAKSGLFEIANKGTVFLDEVAELPPSAQVKLLRVIQEGEIEKIGRTKSIKVDVRIIAATNKDLEKEVREGNFREDLYYRLNVIPIYIPALRDREGDLKLLIEHFFKQYCFDMGREIPTIEDDALKMLEFYEWPGNIRQLKNVVQRLLLNCDENITSEDVELSLINKFRKNILSKDRFNFNSEKDIKPLKDIEREFRESYFRFVRKFSSSDAEAANKLGLAPPNFYRMCKELGIK